MDSWIVICLKNDALAVILRKSSKLRGTKNTTINLVPRSLREKLPKHSVKTSLPNAMAGMFLEKKLLEKEKNAMRQVGTVEISPKGI